MLDCYECCCKGIRFPRNWPDYSNATSKYDRRLYPPIGQDWESGEVGSVRDHVQLQVRNTDETNREWDKDNPASFEYQGSQTNDCQLTKIQSRAKQLPRLKPFSWIKAVLWRPWSWPWEQGQIIREKEYKEGEPRREREERKTSNALDDVDYWHCRY